MRKYIVEEGSWQEACNGIACCECSMLDGDACRIGEYIEKQPIYVEAELDTTEDFGEWIETSNYWETDDLSGWGYWKECSLCHCQEKRRTSFCPNCGADMRKIGEAE